VVGGGYANSSGSADLWKRGAATRSRGKLEDIIVVPFSLASHRPRGRSDACASAGPTAARGDSEGEEDEEEEVD
jgi:hypothetical protein